VGIGVAMDMLVTSLLFPVTTTMLMRQHLMRALTGLGGLVEGVAASQAGQAGAEAGPVPHLPPGSSAPHMATAGKGGDGVDVEQAAAAPGAALQVEKQEAGAGDAAAWQEQAAARRQRLKEQALQVGQPTVCILGGAWARDGGWHRLAGAVVRSAVQGPGQAVPAQLTLDYLVLHLCFVRHI